MNILLVSPYFAPAWGYGGPPKINFDLAKYLVKTGNRVTVLTTDVLDGDRRSPSGEQEIEGVKVIRFKNISNWLAWNLKLFIPIGFSGYIRKHIDEYDFVLLSDFRDMQNIIASRLCIKHNISYSISAYGQLGTDKGLKGKLKNIYDFLWGRQSILKADLLFAQTENELNDYQILGARESQCKILPLGINKEEFYTTLKVNNFRQHYNLPSDTKVILFIGRINHLKGIDLLVNIMPEIAKEVPTVSLVIIGRDDGFYLKELRKLISSLKIDRRVKILEPIYGKESYGAYLSADIFAFTPKFYEETSLACLTSLALGTPVVTVHQSSIPFLEKYKAGYEVELDRKIITRKLIEILKDDKMKRLMGENGKRLIADVFDLPRVGKLLENEIKEKLKEKNEAKFH